MAVASASLPTTLSTKVNFEKENSMDTAKCPGATVAGTKENGGLVRCKATEKKSDPMGVYDTKERGPRVSH